MKTQQLKEEVRKEFEKKYCPDGFTVKPKEKDRFWYAGSIELFLDSTIDRVEKETNKFNRLIKLAKKINKMIDDEGWTVDVHTHLIALVGQLASLELISQENP